MHKNHKQSTRKFMIKRDTCINKLKNIVRDQILIQECEKLMKKIIESRHLRVLERQKSKYEVLHQQKLGGHSNQGHCTVKDIYSLACPNQQETPEETKKWVINLSDQPLTEKQEKLLARGPKFVIKPKRPSVEECITTIEKVPKIRTRTRRRTESGSQKGPEKSTKCQQMTFRHYKGRVQGFTRIEERPRQNYLDCRQGGGISSYE